MGRNTYFYIEIKLIRRAPMMRTKYFEISGIFRRFPVLPDLSKHPPEPVLLNVYGAPELIPRNEFSQPM
jgi:hypothetical protein